MDECGAPERFLGSKLVAVATPDGKLTPELVEAAAGGIGDEHHVQPRVVSITQSTEVGTCYRVDEVAALAEWAHDRGMWLHLDGARLSNACAFLEVGLGAFGSEAGVDVLSFGGTKNGAMGAEAVVSFRPGETSGLRYVRKQSMQLASKMRFIAAQFSCLLTDELWYRNASHANAMARRLAEGVSRVEGVTLAYPVEANGVFAVLPPAVTEALQAEYPFYVWDEAHRGRAVDGLVRHHGGRRRCLRGPGIRGDGRTRLVTPPNRHRLATPPGRCQPRRLGSWCMTWGMCIRLQYRSISSNVDGLAWV